MQRLFAVLLLGLTSLGRAADPQEPKDLADPRSGKCAVVVGGSVGPSFADPAVGGFWHEVNKVISSRLFDRMILAKYRVVRLTIELPDVPNTKDLVVGAMVRQRCDRLLQVATLVGEDIRGQYFGFTISLLHAEPKQKTDSIGVNSTLKSEYSRTYRYARTSESFDSFRTGAFADSAFSEIKASGVLVPLEAQ